MKEMSEELELAIVRAMHRIEQLYYETKGSCYLSFSGGKDSMVVLELIKRCAECYTLPPNAIKAVFCDTRIELDATVEFVKWCKENYYPNIEIIKPEKSFSQVLKENGKPMKSKMKSENIARWQNNGNERAYDLLMALNDFSFYAKVKLANKDLHIMHENFDIPVSNKCCEWLKKKPFAAYNKEHDIQGYFLGLRMAEGGARQMDAEKRLANGGLICTTTKDGRTVKMPIVDWTDENVEEFLQYYNVPLSDAYTKYGMSRTGCIGCPFSRHLESDLKILHHYEPNKYKAALFWLKDVYIAQNVKLPFDKEYETERKSRWLADGGYFDMRKEMLEKFRPDKARPRFKDKSLFK